MNKKNLIIGAAIVLCLGYAIGRYVQPPKEVIKTEIQEKEVIRKDIKTVVKEVTRPDGTKEVVTEIVDKSTEKKDKTVESLISIPKEKQWHINAGLERSHIDTPNIYSLTVERRVFLDAFVGVRVNSEKQIGLTVGYQF